jgi:hypothetical protein
MVLTLPFFLVAVLMLAALRRHIERHLAAWCISAPIVIALVWLVAEYLNLAWIEIISLAEFFSNPGALMRTALVFTCASSSAILFYFSSKWVGKAAEDSASPRPT